MFTYLATCCLQEPYSLLVKSFSLCYPLRLHATERFQAEVSVQGNAKDPLGVVIPHS